MIYQKKVYLFDEYMYFDCIGFVSSNLSEKIANGVCEASYAETARNITDLTGQSISPNGAWNLIQKLGEKIKEYEDTLVMLNKFGNLHRERETKVLFE